MQGFQLLGNGDVYNWQQHDDHVRQAGVASTMIARAALIKPWIFTEIKVPPCSEADPSPPKAVGICNHIDLVPTSSRSLARSRLQRAHLLN